MNRLTFRLLNESDDIACINQLLRNSYKPLAELGMKYAASHEDVEATKKQIAKGECHIATCDGKIVACVVVRPTPNLSEQDPNSDPLPEYYYRSGVATFGRFAVAPEFQRRGLGSKLLSHIEDCAKKSGFFELALDTSEKAHHLISMYEKRGYRFVQNHQWSVTNYQSVVLSKKLSE